MAGVFILADFLWLARGPRPTPRSGTGPGPSTAASTRTSSKLSVKHYVRGAHIIHPVPYLHDKIEYPVLLGFILWLPSWLPGGPASWFAADRRDDGGGHLRFHRPHPPAVARARRGGSPPRRLSSSTPASTGTSSASCSWSAGGGVVRRGSLPAERCVHRHRDLLQALPGGGGADGGGRPRLAVVAIVSPGCHRSWPDPHHRSR